MGHFIPKRFSFPPLRRRLFFWQDKRKVGAASMRWNIAFPVWQSHASVGKARHRKERFVKKALKKHLPLLSLLLLLLVWGLWYTRPVNFFDLNPDLEATSIHGSIFQYGEIYEQIEHLSFDIDADSPQGQSLLADLEAIRVRRSPLNPLRTFYWNHLTDLFPPTLTARQSESGQYQYALHVMGNGDWIALQFNLDEWEYDLPEQPNYFPCRISDGIAFGQSLGDKLMELAKN